MITDQSAVAGMGRESGQLAEELKKKIVAGEYAYGQYLPTVRKLSAAHALSVGTVLRTLKSLEAEGLVVSHPRHGYQVLGHALAPNRGCPIAYVLSAQLPDGEWTGFNRLLLTSLQEAAATRQWSLLGLGAKHLSAAHLIEQCRASRAWGIIVDVHSQEIVTQARQAGLVTILVDAWNSRCNCDAVLQDNMLGGMLAAQCLLSENCRRVGWVGPITESVHSMERFSGASMTLRKVGMRIRPKDTLDVWASETRKAVKRMLSRPDRPDGILALWRDAALDVAAVARELGLQMGRDVKLVGWCSEEQYAEGWRPHFPADYVPPVITWSMKSMAEAAVTRMAERLANMHAVPMRMAVPAWLKTF